MKWSGAAPCQCHSPPRMWMTSPGRMVTTGSPRDWTRPSPSVTHSVWPIEWLCQAVRAPGAKCTEPMLTGEGPWACPMASIHTSPVNHSAGPLAVGFFGRTSMTSPLPSFSAGSGPEQGLDGAALVHGAVALGDLVEGQDEVEDLAGIDVAVPDEVD